MDGSAIWLLAAYAAGIAAASLFGGWLPNLLHITHTRMQLSMAFVAGLILGVAILHLLPHSLAALSGPMATETMVGWVLIGMVATLVMSYLFHFHEHDFSTEHSHQHDRDEAHFSRVNPVAWVGIAAGLSIHSLTEGLTLSSTIRLAPHGDITAASLGVFLAVALHKPLDALSIITAMRANGMGRWACTAANLGFALLCPLAAFATWWVADWFGPAELPLIGRALAFAAGSFLCISLSDLIPEIHFHSHDRLKLAVAFLVGIGVTYVLLWAEPAALHGLGQPG